jgi:hypothetical protein
MKEEGARIVSRSNLPLGARLPFGGKRGIAHRPDARMIGLVYVGILVTNGKRVDAIINAETPHGNPAASPDSCKNAMRKRYLARTRRG